MADRRAELLAELAKLDTEALEAAAERAPAVHNHNWDYLEGYRPLGECVRCDQLRAEKQAQGETPHSHEKQPFGRPVAGCPRCQELAKGARRRPALGQRRWR
jgi:hypothetical protein